MNTEHFEHQTAPALFAYARKLRTTAFDLDRWPALSNFNKTAADYYVSKLDALIEEGQDLELAFIEDVSSSGDPQLTHNESAYANLSLPQALYKAADYLCRIAASDFPDTEVQSLDYAMSGVRNVAADIVNYIGRELKTPFPDASTVALDL